MKKKPKFKGYSQTGYGKKSVQDKHKATEPDLNAEGGADYISAWVNNNLNKIQMSHAEGIADLMKGPSGGINITNRKPKRTTSEPDFRLEEDM